jgi:glycosyltransferase involved in cell wall biosynthesis
MKIGIDASRANRLMRTGTEWYSFHLIKELAKIDKKNIYILYLDKEPVDDLREAIKDKKNFRFKLLKWPWSQFWTLGRLSLEMLFFSPNVLFVPAHGLPFFCPQKTITTVHDVAFLHESVLYRRQKSNSKIINFLAKLFTIGKHKADSLDYLNWSTKRSLRKAKKIIAVSNFTKSEILKHYSEVKKEKIKVIHNGYDNTKYKVISNEDKKVEILNKYGINFPYFLYVGRLEKKKNTPNLLEAFSILKEDYPNWPIYLSLIGSASYGFDEVKYVIEDYNLSPYINIPGWIEEEDMAGIYNSALAFIFPTRHEGFGIPVIEAMASGVPTAVSNLTVLKEVSDDASLFFDYKSPREIADAMIKLYKDEDLRKDLIKKGLKRVNNFSWEKTAHNTKDLIESL